MLEVALKIYTEDPNWSVAASEATIHTTGTTTSPPSGVSTGEEAVIEGDLGLEKEEPLKPMRVCVFSEDDLLADLSLRNPLVANEVSNIEVFL